MEYIERTDDIRKIICISIKGNMEARKLGSLSANSRELAKKMGYFLLFNFTEVDQLLSIEDIYHWFTDHYDKIDGQLKSIPSAHVVNDDNEDFFKNVEVIWRNRGGRTKTFKNEQAACNWLEKIRLE